MIRLAFRVSRAWRGVAWRGVDDDVVWWWLYIVQDSFFGHGSTGGVGSIIFV